MRWKERRVVQQPVAVARAPTSAARAVVVAPALRVVHAVPPEQTAGGGANGLRFKGACNARLTRATRNGDERGREVNARGMCGAPWVLPWPRQAGGVAVWGPEGGEGGEASAGEGPRGRGTALGRWDGHRWGRRCPEATNYGWGCLWAGKQRAGKAVGPGRTFKASSQTLRNGR